MKELTFNYNGPSGEILINIPEFNILRWHEFITNKTFADETSYQIAYEKAISKLNEQKDIIIIVNDSSFHRGKRCYIRSFTIQELHNNEKVF